jgi:hypothetical protein
LVFGIEVGLRLELPSQYRPIRADLHGGVLRKQARVGPPDIDTDGLPVFEPTARTPHRTSQLGGRGVTPTPARSTQDAENDVRDQRREDDESMTGRP